jgi:tRNA(Ile)-lysidine synthase
MSRSDLSQIEQAVSDQLSRHFSHSESPTFIVAVSGGMDSMCLLHVLYKLNVDLVVSHINYQKRGAASDRDAALVEEAANEMGLRCDIAKADPNQAEGQNFQQWAREVRYQQFQHLKEQSAAEGIALGHHEDDQVETILQKIFRGAGLTSWKAMDTWDGELFRPLLGISRAQIAEYVSEHEIPYRTDESNMSSDFARNFLRNEWLDELEHFFPGWKQNVRQIEEQAAIFGQGLDWIAGRLATGNRIKREAFETLPPVLQRALVLRMIKHNVPGVELSSESLDRIKELPELQTGKVIELTDGVRIVRDREHYVLATSDNQVMEPLSIEQHQLQHSPLHVGKYTIKLDDIEDPDFGDHLYLDAQKIAWPVLIRPWRAGDRLQPLGMEGHQKVAEHMTNRKVPAHEKEKALVVESFDKTICAIIFPPIKNQTPPGTISEQVKCDSESKKCLIITSNT